jgi:hypothetical protein
LAAGDGVGKVGGAVAEGVVEAGGAAERVAGGGLAEGIGGWIGDIANAAVAVVGDGGDSDAIELLAGEAVVVIVDKVFGSESAGAAGETAEIVVGGSCGVAAGVGVAGGAAEEV